MVTLKIIYKMIKNGEYFWIKFLSDFFFFFNNIFHEINKKKNLKKKKRRQQIVPILCTISGVNSYLHFFILIFF